jgi:hypothetical protein
MSRKSKQPPAAPETAPADIGFDNQAEVDAVRARFNAVALPPGPVEHEVANRRWFEIQAEKSDRQSFVDAAAIARFGQGYPVIGCYREAVKLWDARVAFLAAQEQGK